MKSNFMVSFCFKDSNTIFEGENEKQTNIVLSVLSLQ